MTDETRKVLAATGKNVAGLVLITAIVFAGIAVFMALPTLAGVYLGEGAGVAVGMVQLVLVASYTAAKLDAKAGKL